MPMLTCALHSCTVTYMNTTAATQTVFIYGDMLPTRRNVKNHTQAVAWLKASVATLLARASEMLEGSPTASEVEYAQDLLDAANTLAPR